MLNRIALVLAIVITLFVRLSPYLMAQSESDGKRLFQEAFRLQAEAQSSGDIKRAVRKYEEALSIFRKIGDLKSEGVTLNNLGNLYKERDQYAEAEEFYQKSLEIAKKADDVGLEGGILNNLGTLYKAWGQFEKAAQCYEKSLDIVKKIGVRHEGIVLNNLGNVYESWGQYARAAELYQKSLEKAKKAGDVREEGHALMGLGTVYKNWGRYAKAVEVLREVPRDQEKGWGREGGRECPCQPRQCL